MKIKKSLGTFTKFLSYLPLMRIVFKVFYTQALKKIKTQYINQENIIDIYLTSNIYSKNFIYGQSDYNLLIIVDNQTHPKSVLKEIRSFIKSSPLLELTINRAYLPVLTQNEYKTSTIKSFLVRKSMKEQISWFSLFDDEKKTFLLRKQDKFALQHNAIQSIDYFMLKEHVSKLTRVKFKQISNSALIINRFYPDSFPLTKLFYKLTARLHRFYLGSFFSYQKFLKETWRSLTHELIQVRESSKYIEAPFEGRLIKYLRELAKLTIIDDITLTPTLITAEGEDLCDKIFIDVHLNQNILQKNYYSKLENLKDDIKKYENSHIKLRVRFTTNSLYRMQNEHALYPFPLEGLMRKHHTYSVMNYQYVFIHNYDKIIQSSIHFLVGQFLRFRSFEQKTDLIGSKFIKSLNLMYKYYLLDQFLKGQELRHLRDEKQVREVLTPQFSNIKAQDNVSEKDWKIIKAQLQYLLKSIRDQLSKYDQSLRVLKF